MNESLKILAPEPNCRSVVLNMENRSESSAVAVPASMQQLVAFYERKTQAFLARYGPGPRVHYHTGLVDEPPPHVHRGRICAAS